VINTPARVAPETAARVQQAIDRLGYRPNVYAQGLMTRRSHLLGLLLPDIHGEFYSELLRGADMEARQAGLHVLVSSDAGRSDSPDDAGFFNSNIVGMLAGLAVMITEPNAALVRQLERLHLPLVVIDKDLTGPRTDRVLVDNGSGAREATEALLRTMNTADVFFLGGPEENFDTSERGRAFIDTLSSRGAGIGPGQVQYGTYDVEWGFAAGKALLSARKGYRTGVLAGNDEIAVGVLQAAASLGVSVPRELQIIGFDDTRIASMVRPQLSAVHVPMSEVGAGAVRLLLQRIQSPGSPGKTVTLPTKLVLRGTTAD
jgi:LacI family transcriptional regulator